MNSIYIASVHANKVISVEFFFTLKFDKVHLLKIKGFLFAR